MPVLLPQVGVLILESICCKSATGVSECVCEWKRVVFAFRGAVRVSWVCECAVHVHMVVLGRAHDTPGVL